MVVKDTLEMMELRNAFLTRLFPLCRFSKAFSPDLFSPVPFSPTYFFSSVPALPTAGK